MKNIKFFGIVLLLIALGCSSTSKITTSWKAPNVSSNKYNKILVLGLIKENDMQLKERMEQHFVGDLTDLGYSAISAFQEYGPKAFENMDEKTAIEKIKNSGVDAVLTIVLLDKKKERNYVPGHYYYYSDNFWEYVGIRHRIIYEPGYYVTNTKYFWESNFYEMGNQSLVYSVQTRSFSPSSTESMGHEYGQIIVKDMVKKEILQERKPKRNN